MVAVFRRFNRLYRHECNSKLGWSQMLRDSPRTLSHYPRFDDNRLAFLSRISAMYLTDGILLM